MQLDGRALPRNSQRKNRAVQTSSARQGRSSDGEEGKDALAFLRIRVLNKTSLECFWLSSLLLSLPLPLTDQSWPIVSMSNVYVSRTQSGSHGTASPISPRPACRRRDHHLLLRRLRPPSRRLSAPVIEKQTARAFITVVGHDRGDTQCAPLLKEKNPANDEEERRGQRKDRPEKAARDGTARCASHSAALSRPVFTDVNASARAHRRESNMRYTARERSVS